MNILLALKELGVEASQTGPDPTNEAEYNERVTVHGARPPWEAVLARTRVVPVADIKAEASRRILARYPEWKQINMIARGVELQNQWRSAGKWTEEEAAEAAKLSAAWNWVKRVRAASDALESSGVTPSDYTRDDRWPGK